MELQGRLTGVEAVSEEEKRGHAEAIARLERRLVDMEGSLAAERAKVSGGPRVGLGLGLGLGRVGMEGTHLHPSPSSPSHTYARTPARAHSTHNTHFVL